MSGKPGEFEADELLRMTSKVRIAEQSVLDDAREVLWSAIASEMLGAGSAGEQAGVTAGLAGREEHRRRTRRFRTGQSDEERRMSMGGGDQER